MSINKANLIAKKMVKNGELSGVSKVKIVAGEKKKYLAIWEDKEGKQHKTGFGDKNYEDFLSHKDNLRRDNFKKRFFKVYNDHKDNPKKPIFWSYQITW